MAETERQKISQSEQNANSRWRALAIAHSSDNGRPQQRSSWNKRATRRKFCFKCGDYDHVVWTCSNSANPSLVTKRFEENKPQKQEN